MQKMMGLLASRFPKVGVIQLLDSGILMGLADGVILIGIVQHLSPQSADIHGIAHISRLLGLAAAVDTSAWAAHDLDEVIVGFTGFYLVQKFSGIAKAGGYGNLYFHACHVVGGFLDACHASHVGEVKALKFLAGQGLHCGAQGCLHNAACGSEDNGGAGAKT